jgi:WhiB family transcriptional regulator, redox-sensing transcriptional regulator
MTRHRNQHTTRAAATPPVAALPDRACAGADPEIFFPTTGGPATEAQALCNICPHQQPCLDWALETEQTFGIWAGTTPDERAQMRRGAA